MSDWLERLRAHAARVGQTRTADALGVSQTTVCLVLKGKYMASTDRIEARVMERLPAEPWMVALRAEVQRTSQARTAARLGLSEATVSQVLSGTYKASTQRIERRVRGELLREECECPVMGDVSLRVCQDVQERKLELISNPQHRMAWMACRGQGRFDGKGCCVHFNGQGSGKKEGQS